ncbi:MAG: pyrroline-5-carboxylate reductase [Clostridia bacterium]|nr:pyrroline-5-carboxylate reductase [Clostridia bacterium]MDD4798015.1 pyrroline-5-carboxylate reductase [Clostridia bacterium]
MKLGFIGYGNMARAIISGIIGSGKVNKQEIIIADAAETARKKALDYGLTVVDDNQHLAQQSDVLFLAVKPQFYAEVIAQIRDHIKTEAVIVTIAPGWSLNKLAEAFGKDRKIVRTMPNTPAMVLEGMTAACPNKLVSEGELEYVVSLLQAFGQCAVVKEQMIDAVIAASGSSPAYVYMFIEALADGAVLFGMPRDLAYKFAAQAVLGSAKMVLETDLHPGALKDMVCSPGGTTIEAVRVLEERGLRSSVIEAMCACVEKSRKL